MRQLVKETVSLFLFLIGSVDLGLIIVKMSEQLVSTSLIMKFKKYIFRYLRFTPKLFRQHLAVLLDSNFCQNTVHGHFMSWVTLALWRRLECVHTGHIIASNS